MNDKVHSIYGLFDPNTGAIKYIGRSVNPTARLAHHMGRYTNKEKSAWIAELAKSGQRPEMIVLERVATLEEAKATEQAWIGRCIKAGASLTNGVYSGYTRGGNRHS
jgi:hypothetical protein